MNLQHQKIFYLTFKTMQVLLVGGNTMFAVGEYVGGTSDVDNWYTQVQGRAGVFDFNLRAYDGTGGLYNMV
ncbi:MAG: alpha-amylase [Paraglaciecola sp.]|jgi:alpha-amylase